jgi:hypothetical protein
LPHSWAARASICSCQARRRIFDREIGQRVDHLAAAPEALFLHHGNAGGGAAMSAAQGLDMIGDIAVFRPRASMSIEQAIGLVKSAIESAREQQIRKLLVVASGLEGFESPSIATRHMLARDNGRDRKSKGKGVRPSPTSVTHG